MKYIIAATVLLCAVFSGCATRQALFAGTAKVDISPVQAVVQASPAHSFHLPEVIEPGAKPDNINDPLFARVLVLKNKNVSLAIVSLDVFLFSSERVIDEAKKRFGLDHVILSATYNNSGMMPRGLSPSVAGHDWILAEEDPGVSVDWPGLSADAWYAATEEKIIAAIGEAAGNSFPARIRAGKGPYESVYLGQNRRLVRPAQGVTPETVIMMWSNPSRIPTSPTDPSVGVVRIEDESGEPRALMVHYACHPVIMAGSPVITADFPGAMADYVEEQLGDSCVVMFLQGAAGDINPYEINLKGKYGLNMMRQSGIALGKAALSVAEKLPSPEDSKAALRIKEIMVDIPYRTGGKSTTACVMTVVIDDSLALVTIPGMPFVEHQLNLSARSPIPNTFMLGNAYCGRGSPFLLYIPTAQAVEKTGYGASEACFVSADAGERQVNAALNAIGK